MKIAKRIFKPAALLFVMSAMLISGSLWQLVQGETGPSLTSNAAAFPKISISITIGRAKRKCGGFGLCKITIGSIQPSDRARTVKGELTTTGDGKLELTLLGRAPEEGATFFVDEDIPLSVDSARRLGLKNAIIQQGEYAFSASKSVLNARLTR